MRLHGKTGLPSRRCRAVARAWPHPRLRGDGDRGVPIRWRV